MDKYDNYEIVGKTTKPTNIKDIIKKSQNDSQRARNLGKFDGIREKILNKHRNIPKISVERDTLQSQVKIKREVMESVTTSREPTRSLVKKFRHDDINISLNERVSLRREQIGRFSYFNKIIITAICFHSFIISLFENDDFIFKISYHIKNLKSSLSVFTIDDGKSTLSRKILELKFREKFEIVIIRGARSTIGDDRSVSSQIIIMLNNEVITTKNVTSDMCLINNIKANINLDIIVEDLHTKKSGR